MKARRAVVKKSNRAIYNCVNFNNKAKTKKRGESDGRKDDLAPHHQNNTEAKNMRKIEMAVRTSGSLQYTITYHFLQEYNKIEYVGW